MALTLDEFKILLADQVIAYRELARENGQLHELHVTLQKRIDELEKDKETNIAPSD